MKCANSGILTESIYSAFLSSGEFPVGLENFPAAPERKKRPGVLCHRCRNPPNYTVLNAAKIRGFTHFGRTPQNRSQWWISPLFAFLAKCPTALFRLQRCASRKSDNAPRYIQKIFFFWIIFCVLASCRCANSCTSHHGTRSLYNFYLTLIKIYFRRRGPHPTLARGLSRFIASSYRTFAGLLLSRSTVPVMRKDGSHLSSRTPQF
jgi:hypothetical protein